MANGKQVNFLLTRKVEELKTSNEKIGEDLQVQNLELEREHLREMLSMQIQMNKELQIRQPEKLSKLKELKRELVSKQKRMKAQIKENNDKYEGVKSELEKEQILNKKVDEDLLHLNEEIQNQIQMQKTLEAEILELKKLLDKKEREAVIIVENVQRDEEASNTLAQDKKKQELTITAIEGTIQQLLICTQRLKNLKDDIIQKDLDIWNLKKDITENINQTAKEVIKTVIGLGLEEAEKNGY